MSLYEPKYQLCSMQAIFFLCLGSIVTAYSQGPPVFYVYRNICSAMSPISGHGGSAQHTPAPFEYVITDSCFKGGDKIQGQFHQQGHLCHL